MQKLHRWLDQLSALPDLSNVHNLYTSQTLEGQIRLANLRRYFELMLMHNPQVLLVGEAPGYQGSYRSGVAFWSEAIMLGPVNKWGLFGGPANGFERVFHDDRIWREPTATVAQRTFDELSVPVLAWATFPQHPHKSGVELSNRSPTRMEIRLGAHVLQELLETLEPERVIAMGNVAAAGLARLGVAAAKVRHPSHGGAAQFRSQLTLMF